MHLSVFLSAVALSGLLLVAGYRRLTFHSAEIGAGDARDAVLRNSEPAAPRKRDSLHESGDSTSTLAPARSPASRPGSEGMAARLRVEASAPGSDKGVEPVQSAQRGSLAVASLSMPAGRAHSQETWLAARGNSLRPHAMRGEFPVPAAMADAPVPFYLKVLIAQDSPHTPTSEAVPLPGISEAAEGRAAADSATGKPAAKSEAESAALEHAQHLFFDALSAAPEIDPQSQEYENWWRAASLRSDEYLRATLGWDRFNTLSRGAKEEILASGQSAAPGR